MRLQFYAYIDRVCAYNTERYARYYYGLVHAIKPKVIVETGVYAGYTTCWIAAAAEEVGARFYAIDNWSEGNREAAVQNIKMCGLTDAVTLVDGDAVECLKDLGAQGRLGGLGLAIFDDLHTGARVKEELETVWPYLEPWGMAGGHDATWPHFPDVHEAYKTFEADANLPPIYYVRDDVERRFADRKLRPGNLAADDYPIDCQPMYYVRGDVESTHRGGVKAHWFFGSGGNVMIQKQGELEVRGDE